MKIVVSVDRFDVRFLDRTPIIDHVAESKWNLLGPPGVVREISLTFWAIWARADSKIDLPIIDECNH